MRELLFKLAGACAAFGLACSCVGNLDYDVSKGIDKQIRLFEDEISVPVGDVGPITVQSLLDKVSSGGIGEIIQQIMTVQKDCTICVTHSAVIYAESVYRIKDEVTDSSQPYLWKPYSQSFSVSSPAALMSFIGLKCANQKFWIECTNPLSRRVNVSASATASCLDMSTFSMSYAGTASANNVAVRHGDPVKLMEFDIPGNVQDNVSIGSLDDISIELPENFTSLVYEVSENCFVFTGQYYSEIAVGETFKLPINIPVDSIGIPVGKFGFRKVSATFEIVNTIPMDVVVNSVSPMNAENVTISGDIHIAGGSLDAPAVTPVTITIEALDGTAIPDIEGLQLDIALAAPSDVANTVLSGAQGISLKSATATLSGGISLFTPETENDENKEGDE